MHQPEPDKPEPAKDLRSIPLPRGANSDTVEATYIDGILEIRAQLPEQSGTSATKIYVSRRENRSPEAPATTRCDPLGGP
jgi:hypothetical protein